MRLWGQIYKDGERVCDALIPLDIKKKTELKAHEEQILVCLSSLSHDLDIERPVIVKKHMNDIYTFGRVVFRPQDFVESVDFDRFVVEVIPDE